jgi:hypothetical protein
MGKVTTSAPVASGQTKRPEQRPRPGCRGAGAGRTQRRPLSRSGSAGAVCLRGPALRRDGAPSARTTRRRHAPAPETAAVGPYPQHLHRKPFSHNLLTPLSHPDPTIVGSGCDISWFGRAGIPTMGAFTSRRCPRARTAGVRVRAILAPWGCPGPGVAVFVIGFRRRGRYGHSRTR